MISLHADGRWIDLIARLPFAFGVDYLTGPVSSNAYWPSLPDSGALDLTWHLALLYTHAISIRFLLALAGIFCWFVLKFFPVTQMVLSIAWVEIAVLYSTILALNIATLYVPYYAIFGICVLTQYFHTIFVTGLRKLRVMEMMSLPMVSLHYEVDQIGHLAETTLLAPWPRFPVVVLLNRVFDPSPFGHVSYIVVVVALILPATFFLSDALVWRGYSAYHALKARLTKDIHMTVISPYYVAVDRCMWHSVGEEIVNRVYALLWLSRVGYHIAIAYYDRGWDGAYSAVPTAIVDATCASFASMCGLGWMLTYMYEWLMEYWFHCIKVSLATDQEREFRLMKYDLTSYLASFCYLGNMLNTSLPWSITHMFRILLFFAAFRLAFIPHCAGLELQRQILAGSANRRTYFCCVFDGAHFPFALGVAFATVMWTMPLSLRSIATGEWIKDRSRLFPADFELWMHGEVLLAVFDNFFVSTSTTIAAIAGHAHLIANGDAKFWHVVLQRTEVICNVYGRFVRDFLSAVLHSVVLSTLFEERTGILLSVTYMSRMMENMGSIHEACRKDFTSQFFCWSKCIIRSLNSPDEQAFSEWNDVCSICRLEETVRQSVCFLPCKHLYHRECIETWLRQQMRCPMCMRKIVIRNGEVVMDQ